MAFRTSSNDNSFNYITKEKIGILSTSNKKAWELRFVSWNGREPKYDIRQWEYNEDGTEIPRKGICLSGEEISVLYDLLKQEAER